MFCRFGACFNISPWILLLLLLAASECFLFDFFLFLPVYQEVIQIFCILIFLMPLAAIFPPSNQSSNLSMFLEFRADILVATPTRLSPFFHLKIIFIKSYWSILFAII